MDGADRKTCSADCARSGGEENERDCKAPVGPQGGRGHLDKWGDTVDVHNVRADGPEVKVIDMAKEKKDQEEHPPRSPIAAPEYTM